MSRPLRISVGLSLAVVSFALSACSVSVDVKTKTKYRPASPVTKTSSTWTGQPVEIENANGSVVVIGDPNATQVSVSTFPFSFADNQADGDAAIGDVTGQIRIEESNGNIYVRCDNASKGYGTAPNGLTGCDDFRVTVPAGGTTGIALKATAHNGSMEASNLTAVSGQRLEILSDNGDVTATGMTGGVLAKSENGDVSASVNIVKGANYEVVTENGDIELSLPGTFSTDNLTLSAPKGKVDVGPFVDLQATSTSRGAAGTGASSIKATATGLGDVTLLQH